jgi:hypothetical protein
VSRFYDIWPGGFAVGSNMTEAGRVPLQELPTVLKEPVRSYEYMVEDSTRVMNRIKALYRSRAISWHAIFT